MRTKEVSGYVELEVLPGERIEKVCEEAVARTTISRPVRFEFNGVEITVVPGELPADVQNRWNEALEAKHEAWINSAEYKEQEAKRAAEQKAERERVMTESASTEKQMREAEVPWPKTEKQLQEYIASLVEREHDYGTCVYAASMAAEATFNYVSSRLGMTGFQASCADLDFLRRSRSIKGPFMILKAEDALYPQYDLHAKLDEMLVEAKPWLKERAEQELLSKETAHEAVRAHWEKLAKG